MWLQPAESYLANRPKGTARRTLIGDPEVAGLDPAWLSQAALHESDRRVWGAVHPAMLSGEFLPDLLVRGLEIARVEMQLTTGDVISLRARPDSCGLIQYSLLNEYAEEERVYIFNPVKSRLPLTFGEIVDLLDGATVDGTYPGYESVIWGTLAFNTDEGSGNPRDLEGFLGVVSPSKPVPTRPLARAGCCSNATGSGRRLTTFTTPPYQEALFRPFHDHCVGPIRLPHPPNR